MMQCTNNADKQSTLRGYFGALDLGCRLRGSRGAPSRVSPGFLPVHVLAGVGP